MSSTQQPTLHSARLLLRPYGPADAPAVQRLAGDKRVSGPTASVPHPYPDGAAAAWIATHAELFASHQTAIFAVTLADTTELVGTVSLIDISAAHRRAEVGYWIGLAHWGGGLCTEAVRTLVAFAEGSLGLTRVTGRCLASNAGSARVMEKAGFSPEGRLARHTLYEGRYEDTLLFGRCSPGRDAAALA